MAREPTAERVVASLRYVLAIVVPLLLLASSFPGRYSVPVHYWLLSIAAVAVFIAGKWWPTAASVTLALLAVPMFATEAWGLSELVPYLGAVAVVDVITRTRSWRRGALAAVAWAAAVVADAVFDEYAAPWPVASAVKILAYVGLPVLLGLYLRGQHDLAASYRERAIDAEARRELVRQQARTDERIALARELHDLVAHQLASIILRSGVAQHVLKPEDEAIRTVLEDVHDTASDALADIRSLLEALRDPDLADVAFVEADQILPEIISAIDRARQSGFTVTAKLPVDATELNGIDALGRLAVLRVIQEAMTNVVKYADADRPVSVAVIGGSDGLRVDICNHSTSSSDGAGHGIVGMRERVHLAGGTFATGATDAGCWRTLAEIPLSNKEIGR
ncbi:sensor histidine kinase [Gordonia sp. CPCC 205333]|uniref:sensor histidine kinase n=1 Tax=Gordonia sp. CPCC 205333 TaxID=3140790 RepID=UPI003AF3543D